MTMDARAKSVAARMRDCLSLERLCVALLLCLGTIPRAQAGATLLLEEPYSYDGALSGTGHAAVYLSRVCAASPVVLRPCSDGETGVVLSRYNGVAGYDWVAIPLIPYLYAVDQQDAVPLFADAKVVTFLRDQYRREHLKSLAPNLPNGSAPEGNWYELIGASYDRTIYGFEIETSPEQDALLISKFNSEPNRERYNFVERNCADFAREVINFYYPRAAHRSLVGDLGITTPKQVAKMLVRYGHRHRALQPSNFVIPQVPGSVRRSKPIRGVLESVVAAKKYMLPLFVVHPYIAGGLLAGYVGHGRFDPARNALIMDSRRELDKPVTSADRRTYLSQLDELSRTSSVGDRSTHEKDGDKKIWERLQANTKPELDASGRLVVQVRGDGEWTEVGVSRANILSIPESSELAAGLLEARIRQELRPATARKTAHSDVENDLALLRQLLSVRRRGSANTLSAGNAAAQATADLR
jgi:hypothetical protein